MINKLDYRVLMTFGGGVFNTLQESYRIARFNTREMDLNKFKAILHKLLAYGWIRGEVDGLPVFSYKSKFGITRRGSDALEFFKQMRYHHTDKKILLSKEGKAMITLPGEKYRNNVYVRKES